MPGPDSPPRPPRAPNRHLTIARGVLLVAWSILSLPFVTPRRPGDG